MTTRPAATLQNPVITPLSTHCGAEISGIDLNAVTDDEFQTIENALADHGVLVFRDQELTQDNHITLARRWGGIDVNNFFPPDPRYPEIAEVRKEPDQQINIGGGWHTDHSFDQIPAMGSILVARELPPKGGDTLFTNMAAVFDSLSDGLKATLRSLKAYHSSDHVYGPGGYYEQTDQPMNGKDVRTGAVHPMVVRHPKSGQELLYVNPAFTIHIEGWTRDESLSLFNYLYEVAGREEFQCRLIWQPGSVAIWDNRLTWHLAQNDYQGHRRLMHRITISGEALAG